MQAAERENPGRHWSGDEVDDVEEYAEGFPLAREKKTAMKKQIVSQKNKPKGQAK